MKEMCLKLLRSCCCDIFSPQLLATAAVNPGKRIARPSTIIGRWAFTSAWSPPSSSRSWLQPVPGAICVAAETRGAKSRLSSSALTQQLLRFRCQELTVSAREVTCISGSNRPNVLASTINFGIWGVSSVSSGKGENYHHHHSFSVRLLGSRDRSRLPPVAPGGGFQRTRTRVCRWVLPALSYTSGGGVVERKNCSRGASAKKAVSSRRFSGLSGKRTSGNFERMELFKPQLMDTVPFRFMSEYHSVPPRAVKDAIAPICFFGFGQAKPVVEVVQAGDPVVHEPAVEVRAEEIGSARIEKIINDMVATMRNAPGVGLAAPQIGVNLQIIVLEDTTELMSYSSPEECEAQQRFPFDLLVIINPKLKAKSGSGSAVFFEGCLSVEGYRALVERDLDVEVSGLGREGRPIRVEASGWKARILQHECDHLAGTLYVDKMVPRTFRTKENVRLPLPAGCPKQGVCKHSTKSLKL